MTRQRWSPDPDAASGAGAASITAFNNHNARGTWQLKVQDRAAVDVGTLNSWSLAIVGNCVPVASACNFTLGSRAIAGLSGDASGT